jgi:hypothetical protein
MRSTHAPQGRALLAQKISVLGTDIVKLVFHVIEMDETEAVIALRTPPESDAVWTRGARWSRVGRRNGPCGEGFESAVTRGAATA